MLKIIFVSVCVHHAWICDTNNPKINASKYHGTYLHIQIQRYFATFLFLKFFCERRLSERDHEKNIFPFPHKRYITFIFSVKNLENLCWSYSISFLKRSSFLKAIQTVDNVIMQKGI